MSSDEFGVYYRADLAQARQTRARTSLLWRLGWTLLLLAAGCIGWYARPDDFGPSAPWYLGSVAAVGAVAAGYQLFRWLQARSEAKQVPPSLAIGLNRDGVLVGQTWYPWNELGSLVVRPGRLGSSAKLVATGRDARTARVLIDYTDALPATLDSAVLAISGGRARVDLSRLDA
ncbi:MAG: hypothetical protein VB080_15955 [Propionicimonas sp.]|uniref:hypothetical protein n=1 Tax=Propionicimonas sp. TaxID=1955623 RepID=UPI002B1EABE1|nr:hypothetical protein [Propionicimonas sp.]MEA4945915.1 hypothetical protein [Propionicimonas sp.]MEA5116535.1 hypothetical protein [Propionicimonas sp.]